MNNRFVPAALAGAVLLWIAMPAPAQSPALRVLAGNGVKAVLDDVRAEAERAVGRPLNIEYSTSASLKKRIAAGEAFDVTIIATDAIADLTKQGKLTPGGHNVARAGVGMGAPAGAPKVNIATAEAFKQAMLKAKSVALTVDGASRATSEKAFERLGIADAMRPKIKLYPAGRAPEGVAKGEAEYILTLMSEIIPVKGLQFLGPLPGDLQNYTTMASAVSTGSKNAAAGKALVEFLNRPAMTQTIKKHGMERVE